MKPIELIFLSREQVRDTGLTMRDVISVVESAFYEHGLGRCENPPKPGIHPQPDAFIHAMPAYLPGRQAAGVKWVSGFSRNYRYELPSIMGVIVLNDVDTGQPIAIMDGSWITEVRTGAVSAVSAKFLAKKGTETIGLVGTGVQGRANAVALHAALPDAKLIRAFDTNETALHRFVRDMSAELSLEVQAASTVQDAIENADIVVTATGRLAEPVFMMSWVKPGALILPVHSRGWEKTALELADKFIVDHWQQFRQAHQANTAYYPKLPEPYAELGEIVCGKRPGRETDLERIINHNYGMAIHDVALAREVFARAGDRGTGTPLTLMKSL
jgi:ornithine cyclodeaminase/alanine dehydrogenase-like protein (mu-crystallin family)